MLLRSFDMEDKDTTNMNITETRKKSDIHAKTEYDFAFLARANDRLVPVEIKDEYETVCFNYDTTHLRSLSAVNDKDILSVLIMLMNISRFEDLLSDYSFELSPSNTFVEINNNVLIMTRDIQTEDEKSYNKRFLLQYKAIIASLLQKNYSYNDYIEGGMSLMSKDEFLSSVYRSGSVNDIQILLQDRYLKYKQEKQTKYIEVNRSKFVGMRIAIAMLSVLFALCVALIVNHMLYVEPYKDASIKLHDAYVMSDYPSAIESMNGIDADRMTRIDRYLLALSYVKTENLTAEQKNNIISTLSINDLGLREYYWIYLGRGEVDMASDIAMQLSDDQLLLYSYMKKRAFIEIDTELTGEERQTLLEQMDSLIDPLVSQYE